MPDTVISDGGPQYTSHKFKMFSEKWGFSHEMSSPGNSKANGAAEAAVNIAKRLLRKCRTAHEDLYLGLLNLRNTNRRSQNQSSTTTHGTQNEDSCSHDILCSETIKWLLQR